MIEIQYAITNEELEDLIKGNKVTIELTKHLLILARQTRQKPLTIPDKYVIIFREKK